MRKTSSWLPGESITIRGVGSKVFWAYPTILVQDTPDLIAFYLRAGTMGKNTSHRVAPTEMLDADIIEIVDHQWHRTDVLFLTVPGEAFSVYIMWEAGTRNLDCIYINLQEPLQRTSIGFDSMDNVLDVVIHPDMEQWRWKDEDEFEEAQRVGVYSPEKARQIRADGESAIDLVLSRRRGMYEKWKLWEVNPHWEIPALPPFWNIVNLDRPE